VRGLIERISVGPTCNGAGFDLEVVGAIAAMIDLGLPGKRAAGGNRDLFESSVKVVAGTGFEPVTFRL
jgi:site-specific DNA recombinase